MQDGFRMTGLEINRVSQCPVCKNGANDVHLSIAPDERGRACSPMGFCECANSRRRCQGWMTSSCQDSNGIEDHPQSLVPDVNSHPIAYDACSQGGERTCERSTGIRELRFLRMYQDLCRITA